MCSEVKWVTFVVVELKLIYFFIYFGSLLSFFACQISCHVNANF